MKNTIKLLTLTLILSLTTFTNAQDASNDATLEETIIWLETYGLTEVIAGNHYESNNEASISESKTGKELYLRIKWDDSRVKSYDKASFTPLDFLHYNYADAVTYGIMGKIYFKDLTNLTITKKSTYQLIFNYKENGTTYLNFENQNIAERVFKAINHLLDLRDIKLNTNNHLLLENKF